MDVHSMRFVTGSFILSAGHDKAPLCPRAIFAIFNDTKTWTFSAWTFPFIFVISVRSFYLFLDRKSPTG